MKNGFYSLQEYQAEKTNNLLYITVNPSAGGIRRSKTDLDKTRIIDIVIYNLNDHTLKYLFVDNSLLDDSKKRSIVSIIFEQEYDRSNKMMSLNTHSANIINNQKIEKREPSEHLFILIESKKKGEFELWQSTKLGTALRLIKSFTENIEWRLDITNQKILFIQKKPYQVHVESFDW